MQRCYCRPVLVSVKSVRQRCLLSSIQSILMYRLVCKPVRLASPLTLTVTLSLCLPCPVLLSCRLLPRTAYEVRCRINKSSSKPRNGTSKIKCEVGLGLCRILHCRIVPCLALPCLVGSGLVLSCIVLSSRIWSCLVFSGRVCPCLTFLSYLALSFPVWSGLV